MAPAPTGLNLGLFPAGVALSRIVWPVREDASPRNSVLGAAMQCPRCGAPLAAADDRFCGACGFDLTSSRYTPNPAPAKRRSGPILGIAAGVLLLFAGLAAAAVLLLPKLWPVVPTKPTVTSPAASGSASTSAQGGTTSATNSRTTIAVTPTASRSPQVTAPPTVTLDRASAIDLVGTYLDDAKSGRTSTARAVVTSKYLSRIASNYYALVEKDLIHFEVIKVEKGQGGLLVFVKEKWRQGTWTNWYLVIKKADRLVINDTGTA